jgi:hypothetical protein
VLSGQKDSFFATKSIVGETKKLRGEFVKIRIGVSAIFLIVSSSYAMDKYQDSEESSVEETIGGRKEIEKKMKKLVIFLEALKQEGLDQQDELTRDNQELDTLGHETQTKFTKSGNHKSEQETLAKVETTLDDIEQKNKTAQNRISEILQELFNFKKLFKSVSPNKTKK